MKEIRNLKNDKEKKEGVSVRRSSNDRSFGCRPVCISMGVCADMCVDVDVHVCVCMCGCM